MMKVDTAELLDATEVAVALKLSQRSAVSVYRAQYPDFPAPLIEKGRCVLWLRADITRWAKAHPGRNRVRASRP